MTAFHVPRAIPGGPSIQIVFGGSSDGLGTVINDNFTLGLPFDDDDSFRSGVDEENVLLAHRLWALDLKAWAVDTSSGAAARTALRQWIFEPAQGSVPYTWFDQGYLEYDFLDTNSAVGRDIAVLKAQVLDAAGIFGSVGDPNFIPTGEFVLDKPGVFFDWVEHHPFEALRVERDFPLAAVYTNLWPGDTEDPNYYPLAARDGYYMGTVNMVEITSCKGKDTEAVDRYTDNILTTVDDTTGSSGGGTFGRGSRRIPARPSRRVLYPSHFCNGGSFVGNSGAKSVGRSRRSR